MATVTKGKGPCVELAALQKMTNDLCNALPIDDLFPSMISHRVIDFNDKADICAERTERRRVGYFLEKYLTKGLNLQECDTTRFYRFLTVMERSPKCDFLVERMKRYMEECEVELAKCTGKGQLTEPLAPSAPPPATTAAASTTAPVTVSSGRHVTRTPANVPVDNTISGDTCLATGKDSKKCMKLMHKCVIPKISEEWEAVATFLDYSIQAKNNIKATYGTSRQCCTALLEDWVNTDNGVEPKTWKKLMEVLGEVDELEEVISEIRQGLISAGVSFDVVPVEECYDYEQPYEETNPQGVTAGMQQYGHQYTTTDPQQQAPNEMWRHEQQFGQYTHPSYDPSSTYLDQYGRPVTTNPVPPAYNTQPHVGVDQYGRPVTTNPVPPAYNTQPHAGVDQYGIPMHGNQAAPEAHGSAHPTGSSAFILYSKEENDPQGEQVLCLSNLLCNCGINCDIDIYHTNDVDITDWAFWVGKSLEYHIYSHYSYVILVCSSIMISTLEQRNDNACLRMVAGYIDRLTLRHYLQEGAHKFLPLFINNPSEEYVPPSLSGKTRYYFPYDKLVEMPENVSAQQVLDHPDFGSMRSLVATLTGQQEIPPPHLGHVPPVRNMTGAPHHTYRGNTTVRTRGPPTGNSPKLIRRGVDLPPSTLDQDSPGSIMPGAPETVTLRTAEQQAHDMQHGGRVAAHQHPPTGAHTQSRQLRTQRPSARNSPKLLRRDTDLPPSANDQDAPPYDNISESVKSQVPQDVVPRTAEQQQVQYYYGGQVLPQAAAAPHVQYRQSTGLHTMEPQEETGGLKRTHESSSDDDDYGTPTDSPRDDSLGTLDSAHHPIQTAPSFQQGDSVNASEIDQVTACTDQDHSNYHIAFVQQNK